MSTCPVISTEHITVGTDVNLNSGGLKLELFSWWLTSGIRTVVSSIHRNGKAKSKSDLVTLRIAKFTLTTNNTIQYYW